MPFIILSIELVRISWKFLFHKKEILPKLWYWKLLSKSLVHQSIRSKYYQNWNFQGKRNFESFSSVSLTAVSFSLKELEEVCNSITYTTCIASYMHAVCTYIASTLTEARENSTCISIVVIDTYLCPFTLILYLESLRWIPKYANIPFESFVKSLRETVAHDYNITLLL